LTPSLSARAKPDRRFAGRLTEAGMKVALNERELFGGTCVNTGCTPTKTLIAGAYTSHWRVARVTMASESVGRSASI
jgi:pyruvate/2-oxoglutarate dehydrogenase complex dihydrolipoamide dehydrogenase (E3) component